MPAELLLDERHVLNETAFAELVVWRVPAPVRGSRHEFRYRLALVVGDHRHVGEKEYGYRFRNAEQLLADFWADVEEVMK